MSQDDIEQGIRPVRSLSNVEKLRLSWSWKHTRYDPKKVVRIATVLFRESELVDSNIITRLDSHEDVAKLLLRSADELWKSHWSVLFQKI